jgi:hypothetical protein
MQADRRHEDCRASFSATLECAGPRAGKIKCCQHVLPATGPSPAPDPPVPLRPSRMIVRGGLGASSMMRCSVGDTLEEKPAQPGNVEASTQNLGSCTNEGRLSVVATAAHRDRALHS